MTVVFDHIAIALPAISEAPAVLVGELGGESTFGGPAGEFKFWQWRFAGDGVLEVLEPLGSPGGFVHRFLEKRGRGVHHVTFKVPSLSTSCERAEKLGYQVVGRDDSDPFWKEAFLHPKEALGIVVQIVEVGDRPPSGGPPRDEPPAEPARAAATSEVVGLRLTCRDHAAALRQWGELLEGIESPGPGDQEGVIFRWPGSPMRLFVLIDPDEENGPIGIEMRGAPTRSLGVRSELGTALFGV